MNLIAAADQNWAIGKGGDLLCRIPADLRHFQEFTTGHAVILGRKTLGTFPGGRPLESRRNLILSRNPAFAPDGAEVFRDVDSLLAAAPDDTFVIGGASVYEALLSRCDTAYITKLEAVWPGVDAFFPNLDIDPAWEVVEAGKMNEYEGIKFRYMKYRRTKII